MVDVRDPLSELRRRSRRGAVATLVAAGGGARRRIGATMCVDSYGGIIGSVTIGGCVDGRVVEAAEQVVASGRSERLSVALGDEDAWAFGMTCAGSVDVLIEPVDASRDDDVIASARAMLARACDEGRAAVEIAPLAGPPARLIVTSDGDVHGSLGDPLADRNATEHARRALVSGTSGVASVAGASGLVDLFFRVQASPATIVIVGATDVAVALVALAGPLEFRTVVIDGRERFATRERFPHADSVQIGIPSEVVEKSGLGPASALVLLSHDYKYDVPVLEVALRTRAAYIGVLGSRRRGRALLDYLASQGVSAEDCARIRVPVGLDIGARTPAEIALSVIAEIVAVREGKVAGALRRRDEAV